jgi:hypothetical protein
MIIIHVVDEPNLPRLVSRSLAERMRAMPPWS